MKNQVPNYSLVQPAVVKAMKQKNRNTVLNPKQKLSMQKRIKEVHNYSIAKPVVFKAMKQKSRNTV